MNEILNHLKQKYNKLGLSRTELSKELNLSLATLDRMLAKGEPLPDYKKIGRQYIFPLIAIADFFKSKEEKKHLTEEEKMG